MNACGEVVGIQAIGATVHVSVLIPELRQRNIGFTLASDPCNPLWPPVATYAAIGDAALLGLILLVLAFRRPRQRAAGTVGSDTTDRRSRGRAPNAGGRTAPPRPADPGRGWALSGFAHDGRAIHIAFQEDRITKAGRVLTIGRDPELCQIVLDDDTVSGCHARLQARPDPLAATFTFFVEDLGSTNGTAVNGKPVHRPFKAVPLPIGSTLRIGGCRMTFTRG